MVRKIFKGRLVLEYLAILLGAGVAAAGNMLFLVPARISAGGVSGIATILYHTLSLPVWAVTAALNIPLFLIGFRYIGRDFFFKSLFAAGLYSLFCAVIPAIALTGDEILATVYGGVLTGLGLGVVIRLGGSTGGSDMAGLILHENIRQLSAPAFIFIVDFCVIAASGAVFGLSPALYAVATVFICSKGIEFVTEGLNTAKAYMIITSRPYEVGNIIVNGLVRGATLINGMGVYTGQPREVILCVLQNGRESHHLKLEVRAVDPGAFIIAYDVKEVMGEGFSQK